MFFFLNSVVQARAVFRGFVSTGPVSSSGPQLVRLPSYQDKINFIKNASVQFKSVEFSVLPHAPGIYKTNKNNYDFVIASNIHIHATISGKDLTAWVIDQGQNGLSTRHQVHLYDCHFKKVRQLSPDKQGFYLASNVDSSRCGKKLKSFFLVVSSELDFAYLGLDWNKGFENWKQSVSITKSEKFRLEATDINTFIPTGFYFPGDEAYIYHTFKTLRLRPQGLVFKNVADQESFEVLLNQPLSKYANSHFKIPKQASAGVYELFYRDKKQLFATSLFITVLPAKTQATQISVRKNHADVVFSEDELSYQLSLGEDQKARKRMKILSSIKVIKATSLSLPKDPTLAEYRYYFDPSSASKMGGEQCGEGSRQFDFQFKEKFVEDKEVLVIPRPELESCHGPVYLLITLEFWESQKLIKRYEEKITYLPTPELIISKFRKTDDTITIEAAVYNHFEKKIVDRKIALNLFLNFPLINRTRLVGGNYSTTVLDSLQSASELCRSTSDKLNSWVCHFGESHQFSDKFFRFQSTDFKTKRILAVHSLGAKPAEFQVNNRSSRNLPIRLKKPALVGDKAQLLVTTPFKQSNVVLILENEKFRKRFFYSVNADNPVVEYTVEREFAPKYFATVVVQKSSLSQEAKFEDVKFAVSHFFTLAPDAVDMEFDSAKTTFLIDEKNTIDVALKKSAYEKIEKVLIYTISDTHFLLNDTRNVLSEAYRNILTPFKSETSSTFAMNQEAQDSSPRHSMLNEASSVPWSKIAALGKFQNIWNWTDSLQFDQTGKIKYHFQVPSNEFNGEFVYIVAKAFLNSGREVSKFTRLKLTKQPALIQPDNLIPVHRRLSKVVVTKADLSFQEKIVWPISNVETHSKNVDFLRLRSDQNSSHKIILDRDSQVVGLFRTQFEKTQLNWVPLQQVPELFQKMLLIAEDKNYFDHSGVDWLALANATVEHLKNSSGSKRGGASTISMQLANLLSPDLKGKRKEISDKYTQIKRAFDLESSWTKTEILEAYLNLVPLRGDLVGLSAASLFFFKKHPSLLSEFESALLIAMIPSPNTAQDLLVRRGCHLIAKNHCDEFKIFVEKSLLNLAQNKSGLLLTGSFPETLAKSADKIHFTSTLNLDLQNRVRGVLQSHISRFKRENLNEAAAIVIDNRTSEIISYIPNVGAGVSTDYFIDHALSLRQPGSTLKPFIYAVALDKGLINLNTKIEDSPISEIQKSKEIYSPLNFDLQFRGSVTIAEALSTSLNVPAVKVMQHLDEKEVRNKLVNLGLSNIDRNRNYGSALMLGATEVSLLDLSRAYNRLFYGAAFKPQTVAQLKLMLSQSVYRKFFPDQNFLTDTLYPYIIKTGTSNFAKDIWCIAVNDHFTIGVWLGNSNFDPPWNIGNFNGALLMQSLLMGIEDFQTHSLSLDYSVANLDPMPLRRRLDENDYIKYPLPNSLIKRDPNLPQDLQQVRVIVNTKGENLFVRINDQSDLMLNDSFAFTPARGVNKVQVLSSSKTVLESVSFEYVH